MTTITFDTLTLVEKLKEAKIIPAEALVTSVATKQDVFNIERLIDALDAKVDKLDTRIAGELALFKWILGLVLGGIFIVNHARIFPCVVSF